MKEITELIYLSSSFFLNNSANAVHTARMANALSKKVKKTIVYANYELSEINKILDEYMIDPSVRLIKYPLKVRKSKILKLIGYSLFAIKLKSLHSNAAVFYGRNLLLIFFLLLLGNKRVAVELHGIYEDRFKSFFLSILLKKIPLIVVISHALKNDILSKYNINTDKVVVLPDGSDEVIHNNLRSLRRGNITVGYVGGFYSGRGVELIIELAKRLPQLHFLLVGATNSSFSNSLEREGISNIEIVGYVPYIKLSHYYERIDIAIAPYGKKISVHGGGGDTSKWASPLKIFEYMAYKKCILISEIDVFKEILTDNYTCLFCSPSDVDDWEKKINLLVNDEPLRDKLSENALKEFKLNYTWEKRAIKLVSALEKTFNITI